MEFLNDKTQAENEFAGSFTELNSIFTKIPKARLQNIIEELLSESHINTFVASMLIHLGARINNSELLHTSGSRKSADGPDLSYLPYPVGMVSQDGSSILGREGFVFLIGGSNNVIGQYDSNCEDASLYTDKWIDLLHERHLKAKERDINLYNIIIPEKISIISDLFPYPLRTPSGLLDTLENRIKHTSNSNKYISGRYLLSKGTRSDYCRKLDSHLSPLGSFQIFKEIMRVIFNIEIKNFKFDKSAYNLGDLCFRMLGMFVADEFKVVEDDDLPQHASKAKLVETFVPSTGEHSGRRQIWNNDQAPINLRVLVFGNSFFSFVENGQCTLSWWFSCWIKDFHFVWSNEIDWDYVDLVKPDVVIWQGIERFLTVVPAR